jgi:hypothetical protein
MTENKSLQTMMLGELKDKTSDRICENLDPLSARRSRAALGVKRMIKLFKQIDKNGRGCLDFEEFKEFFRMSGFLLEYSFQDNPRSREEQALVTEEGHLSPKSKLLNVRRRHSTGNAPQTNSAWQDKVEDMANSVHWARRKSETVWAADQLSALRKTYTADANAPQTPRKHGPTTVSNANMAKIQEENEAKRVALKARPTWPSPDINKGRSAKSFGGEFKTRDCTDADEGFINPDAIGFAEVDFTGKQWGA